MAFKPGQSGNPEKQFRLGHSGNESTQFQKGRSGNPGGRPKRTPYQDAYRKFADLPFSQLNISEHDTTAEATAKAVSRHAIYEGNIRAAIEARECTEGKIPLPLVNGEDGGFVLNVISHIPRPDRSKPEKKKKSDRKVN